MFNIPANFTSTVVVGAGPYGLSLASHLRAKGLPFRIFGQPMGTWSTQMPEGMRLQSPGFASNLSTGETRFTLGDFCAETGRPYRDTGHLVPLEDFIAYGQEFARRLVPSLEPENIRSIKRSGELFRLKTAGGEQFFAKRVVIATGLSLYQHVPKPFRLHVPSARITHPSQHRSFAEFAGREVTVVGRGPSSLNAAAMLHEAGARVTLIARSRKIHLDRPLHLDRSVANPAARALLQRLANPSSCLGYSLRSRLACEVPDIFRLLPARARRLLLQRHLQPSGDAALHGRLNGFEMLLGAEVHAVEAADGSGERLRLTLTDAQGNARQHLTSHLIAGTGYRIDLDRLGMLCPSLREGIRVDRQGAPRLNRAFESSVPGLHMIGPAAAPTFGPMLRFVAGAAFASDRVAREIERSLIRERRFAERHETVQVLASTTRGRAL